MAQTIIVDISTRGANPVAYTHQGDTGRTFFAEIYENGEPFAVAGYTIKVGAILPADRGYYVIAGNDMVTATKTNDNTTNKIYFTLSDKYSLKAGNGILTLIFTSNTGTPSTIRPINIDLRIQKSADADDTIAGASDFPEGLEAIAEEVFQEYLSTYLPPVAPSASAAANKAADAKLTGEALDDLKSAFVSPSGTVISNKSVSSTTGGLNNSSFYNIVQFEIDGSIFPFVKYSNIVTKDIDTLGMAFYSDQGIYISGNESYYSTNAYSYEEIIIPVPSNARIAKFTAFQNTATYGLFSCEFLTKYGDSENELHSVLSYSDFEPGYIRIAGKLIRAATGEIANSVSFDCTDYISIDGEIYSSMKYTRISTGEASPTYGMAFYDKNKECCGGQSIKGNSTSGIELTNLDIPADAKYARFTIRHENEYPFTLVLYSKLNKKQLKTENDIATLQNAVEEISEEIVTTEIPEYSIVAGENVNVVNDGAFVQSWFSRTGYIDVDYSKYAELEYKKITSSDESTGYGMCFYDVDHHFISGIHAKANSVTGYITERVYIPKNAKYAAFTVRPNNTYGEFTVKLYLRTAVEKRIFDSRNGNGVGGLILPWKTATQYEESISNPQYFGSAAALYAAYDAIFANQNVTKTRLGYASDANGNPDTTLPIYEYIINDPLNDKQIYHSPVILLTSGIHSDEKSAIMSLYYFIADVMSATSGILKDMKNNYTIKIVPLINPWGYDNTTTHNEGRENARGVNLNRNFSYNWDITTGSDKGTAPYSELETQALKGWLDINKEALFHIDFHNHGYGFDYAMYYIASNCTKHRKIWASLIRGVMTYFENHYNIDFDDMTHFQEANSIPSLSAEALEVCGIDSSIVETPYGTVTGLDSSVIPAETCIIGNSIIYFAMCSMY